MRGLPLDSDYNQQPRRRRITVRYLAGLASTFVSVTIFASYLLSGDVSLSSAFTSSIHAAGSSRSGSGFIFGGVSTRGGDQEQSCPQGPAIKPPEDEGLDANKGIIFSKEYRKKSASVVSGLVQIPSQSYDDIGFVGEDPRWEVFYQIPPYLEKTFPLAHTHLRRDLINTHAILFTWNGSDPSLKPAVLMAHTDVVPVPESTLLDWDYPPFSGHYDGTYIHGRGASDCKNTVTGILESLELLLHADFRPRRTIYAAFGFDEESRGWGGAGKIVEHLVGKLGIGENDIAWVVDEGGLGVGRQYGGSFAYPSTGEKGSTDVNFTLHTPGGHSSTPPPINNIGILSEIAVALHASPPPHTLTPRSPIYPLLQCAATHGHLDRQLQEAVEQSRGGPRGKDGERERKRALETAAELFAKIGRKERALVGTTQALDIIHGGVKVNALPELAYFTVNHRISVDSGPQEVFDRIRRIVLPIAKKHKLYVDAFGKTYAFNTSLPSAQRDVPGGELFLSAPHASLPSPVSPINSTQWAVLSGVIKHVWSDQFPNLVVSPSIMTGGTDTRFYWNLTKHIYRFSPLNRESSPNAHTVNERLSIDGHLEGVWFFHELLRVSDVSDFESTA